MNLDELIKKCIKQNRKAQEELYQEYKKMLYVLCLKYCTNEVEAEDNLHDAFIEIFSNIKNYKGRGSFEGWIKRITINKAIARYKQSYLLTAIKDEYPDDDFINENEIDLSLDTILSFVQELPHQYRLVFSLYELDDYSHQEIAEMLSISENTSKSNLHRAKQILKEKIKSKSTFYYSKQKNGK
ncbi:RNA polymerase sigma-70 factor, ECF subfamily [Flavobacterium resistens]|uniref:RNA polymerase sigma-70 factor, ECF subfamily n=1 Tax=Flavobacterium resistens TaxID=443612 RepID=A0A521CFG0_9FLAO|nr:RNA polymerase sigma factor [Flavobacterium resistens]MRX66574.1 sigma-70 family RNA polymerase sigma factor [Flavobacterium resistens]SMO58159.1 RNA polymerase sigma-70 factor, ECF subfamily [Flavobacterium resistens]